LQLTARTSTLNFSACKASHPKHPNKMKPRTSFALGMFKHSLSKTILQEKFKKGPSRIHSGLSGSS